MRRVLIVMIAFFAISACKRPIAEPETIDPIYRALKSDLDVFKKEEDNAANDVKAAKKEIALAAPQTGEYKVRLAQFFDAEKKLAELKQKRRFLEIHLQTRKGFARKSYEKAFEKDIPWPDPEEYRLYQANRKLANDPRSWDERLRIYFQSRAPAAKKEDKKSAGGGH
ncbi:MAG: hypothetical protein AB7F59_01120 [Bdellovibrionales bacterium]